MTSVVLTEYTDPNCTWSWGAEPIVRHLGTRYGDQIEIEFVLGGLVRDFEDFHDAANDISEPGDVAPHWEEASEQHGMPVDVGVWDEDPPRSTYPASIATKAAFLQDSALGFRYLRRVREATLTERRNIARWETLWEIAESVGIELSSFAAALEDGRAERAAAGDLRSESRGNGRFWLAAGAADAVRRGTGELALRDELPWEGRAEPGRRPGRPGTSETADAARGRSGPRLTTYLHRIF